MQATSRSIDKRRSGAEKQDPSFKDESPRDITHSSKSFKIQKLNSTKRIAGNSLMNKTLGHKNSDIKDDERDRFMKEK